MHGQQNVRKYENEFVFIRVQRIYRSRVNCNETEGSYECTGRFCLTSVKIEELLSMVEPFFFPLENQLKLRCPK